MAYGLKYTGTFYSNVGNYQYDVSIYQKDYIGSSSDLTFGNVTITRGDSDLLQSIKGSEANLEIINDTDFKFESEFGSANYGDFYVVIDKDSSTLWQGYNIPNTFTEPYEITPYFTELKFNCGLGHLKYKFFEDAGNVYSGQKSILEVVRLCLNRLPNAASISQSIRESINIFEDSLYGGTPSGTDSMINSIFVDTGLYKKQVEGTNGVDYQGWSCYKVIEEILKIFNARIYSWKGLWYIDQIREQKDALIYYRDFLPRVGSEDTLTIDGTGSYNPRQAVNRSTLHPTPEGEISILPALEKIKYKYFTQNVDYLNNDIITNGYFSALTTYDPLIYPNSTGSPSFWNFTGFNPEDYAAIYFNGVSSNWFQFDPSSVQSNDTFNDAVYFHQQKLGVGFASTDKLRLQIKSYIEADWTTGTNTGYNISSFYNFVMTANVEKRFKLKLGNYYLNGFVTGSNSVLNWTTTDSYFTINRQLTNGPQGNIPLNYSDSGTVWSDVLYTFDTPTIPFSGVVDVDFYVYEPFHEFNNFTDTNGFTVDFDTAYYTGLSAIYVPAAAPPEEEVILQHEIDEEAEELSIEVIHGDGPVTVSQGSFRLSNGLITDNWARLGVVESKGIAEIWIEDISELRSKYTRQLSWSLVGTAEMYNTISHFVNGSTDYYIINGFDFNLTESTYDLTLIKLGSETRTAYTTTKTSNLTQLPLLTGNRDIPILPSFDQQVQRTAYSDVSVVNNTSITSYNDYKNTGYYGFYTFNENDTSTIRDYSQNGNDGTGSNLTILDTTRTYGKDAIFNGTTSKIDLPTTTAFQGLLELGFSMVVNITSNTGTDTILKMPNVFELKFDGSYFSLDFETIISNYNITQTGGVISLGSWYTVVFSTKTTSFNLSIYDDNGDEVFNGSASKSDVTNSGSNPIYIGYDGSTNYANFKCNELQLCPSAVSPFALEFRENEQGILITSANTFNVGDIVASNIGGLNTITAIVTYADSQKYIILPVDGQAYQGMNLERAGHLWDTDRQWQFIINNDPSICFYDGINLTSLIASSSKKVYCLTKNGILKNLISKSIDYTLINTDEIILVDCSSADVTITCPPSADATPSGKVFEIIDIGNANPNRVIINGGDFTINGESATIITEPYEVRKIIFTGTEYILI